MAAAAGVGAGRLQVRKQIGGEGEEEKSRKWTKMDRRAGNRQQEMRRDNGKRQPDNSGPKETHQKGPRKGRGETGVEEGHKKDAQSAMSKASSSSEAPPPAVLILGWMLMMVL